MTTRQQIENLYDRAFHELVMRGLDEVELDEAMQREYTRIDAAMNVRPRGAANAEKRNA